MNLRQQQWPGLERLAEVAGYGHGAEKIVPPPPGTVEVVKSALSRLADFRKTGVMERDITNGRPTPEQIRKFKSQMGFMDLC